MKNSVLLLGVVLLAGCAAEHPAKLPPKALPPATPPSLSTPNPAQVEASEEVRRSGAVLEQLMRTPQNAVPDAILNRTKCILLALPPSDIAIASCRHSSDPDHWSPPVFLNFAGPSQDSNGQSADRLVLLMSNRAVEALESGTLELGTSLSISPGLMVRQTPTALDRDLSHDAVTYRFAQGVLMGAAIPATSLSFSARLNEAFYGRMPESRALLIGNSVPAKAGSEFVAMVSSYFTTIAPVGVIIHHTGIVPAYHKVPTNALEVDQYHAQRGFAITCFGRVYHVAYHYLIFPDGRIEAGRPERCEGAHARGYNAYLGISLVGDFSSQDNPDGDKGLQQPTQRQIRSLISLIRQLRRRYRIPVHHILRHADISPTACPGDRLPFKLILTALERSP